MLNVNVETKGTLVTLTFDASKDFGRSASGKTTIVATTQGNKKIVAAGREINIGLNAYVK